MLHPADRQSGGVALHRIHSFPLVVSMHLPSRQYAKGKGGASHQHNIAHQRDVVRIARVELPRAQLTINNHNTIFTLQVHWYIIYPFQVTINNYKKGFGPGSTIHVYSRDLIFEDYAVHLCNHFADHVIYNFFSHLSNKSLKRGSYNRRQRKVSS